MSVTRSPTTTQSKLDNLLTTCSAANYVTGTGSQPDLSKISGEISETQITYRKRNLERIGHDCLCSDEIKLMRSDLSRVSSLLEKYIDSNAQMIKEMNASIVEVKYELADLRASHEQTKSLITSNAADITAQIQNVQSTTTQLTTEQCNIKSQLTQFENKIVSNQNKLQNLETNISKIQLNPHSSQSELSVNEQIFREIQDRNRRQNNIIISGISEQICINTQERIFKDESDVLNVITSINPNITKPNKIFRIGKYNIGKTRGIKVCFNNPDPVMLLLRSKGKLPDNIKFYSDQTPSQQKYFQTVKNELARRTEHGETDLIIKYINGIPTIIKQNSKNSDAQ